jgi:hypothetical protein
LEGACRSRVEAETRVIGGIAEHEDEPFTTLGEQREAAADQSGTNAAAPKVGGNRERRESNRRIASAIHVRACGFHRQAREGDATHEGAIRLLGNEHKDEIIARTQTPHEVRLSRAAEGVLEEGAHGRLIAGPLEAQFGR